MALPVTDIVAHAVRQCVRSGSVGVDATVGNGLDSVLLARAVGPTGHVYGFDVQQQALDRARARLAAEELDGRVTLRLVGHEAAADALPAGVRGRIGALMFNLGYLPGGDHSVTTGAPSTIRALDGLWPLLEDGALVTLVLYRGHTGGAEEADAVTDWVESRCARDAEAARYHPLGTLSPAPEAILLRRRLRSNG